MSLSTEEKVQVRTALGYPNLGTAPLLAMGVPAAGHMSFLVERAMDYLLPEAEQTVRDILQEIQCIESQMSDAKARMRAAQTGDIKLRAREEEEDLKDQFIYWTAALSDVLSIGPNPFSFKHRVLGTNGWRCEEPC